MQWALIEAVSILSVKDTFVSKPSTSSLKKLQRTELVEVATYYELTVSSSFKKDDIRQVILEHLWEEELHSDEESDDGQEASSATLELKRLEFEENERARENSLRMKELEIKEKELAMQLKLKELEAKTMSPHEPHSKSLGFDINKHIWFVPPFQQWEIDKYFLHFENGGNQFRVASGYVDSFTAECASRQVAGDLCSPISRSEFRI